MNRRPLADASPVAALQGKAFERFSDLVDGIYRAGLEPNHWSHVVQQVAELNECPRALLLTPSTPPRDGGFMFSHGLSAAHMELWANKYVHHDPWVKAASERDIYHDGSIFFSEDLLSREELEKTLFYREYLTQVDMGGFCTGVVFNGSKPGFVDTSCSFHRTLKSEPFAESSKTLHSHTIKHLSRSLGTMFRLRDAELRLAASMAALDHVSAGVLLFGERGNVVFANVAAQRLLSARDGLGLRAGDPANDGMGWIVAESGEDQARLTKAITEAIAMEPLVDAHFLGGMAFRRRSGRPLLLQLSSLTAGNEFSRGQRESWAIGFLSELGAAMRLDPTMLKQVFDLSPAESVLAQELLAGNTLEQVAATLGLSPNTVKTQLQNVYAKTQTNRQSQLVRLLMGLASDRPR